MPPQPSPWIESGVDFNDEIQSIEAMEEITDDGDKTGYFLSANLFKDWEISIPSGIRGTVLLCFAVEDIEQPEKNANIVSI